MAQPGNGTNRRILLIEDEATVARLTELVLTGAGYTVEAVTDHGMAAGLLENSVFGLVIADTDLGPHTAGLAGLAPLITSARCPVLLFSAHRFSEAEIVAAGFAGVIQKPYDIDDLLRVVGSALANNGSPAPNDTEATPV